MRQTVVVCVVRWGCNYFFRDASASATIIINYYYYRGCTTVCAVNMKALIVLIWQCDFRARFCRSNANSSGFIPPRFLIELVGQAVQPYVRTVQ